MKCFLIGIFILASVAFCSSAPYLKVTLQNKEGIGKGYLDKDAKDILLANCQLKTNKCKGQTTAYRARRQKVKAALFDILKNQQANMSDAEVNNEIEHRLKKVYELKKKLHLKNALIDIDPADDGMWQGDILLTADQSDQIMQILDNLAEVVEPPVDLRQKRSASEYFEITPNELWKMPINYWISGAFTRAEFNEIENALREISWASGCIIFAKNSTRLQYGSQIQYLKMGATSCEGASNIGYQGINTINLWTNGECTGETLKGLVMHETIHALGGGHEQSRTDRNYHIEILWNNIDPQDWAQYEVETWTTTYGVPYDYRSIMHYQQGLFQNGPGLETMKPRKSSQLGSKYLSANDVLQLRRMYCKSGTCLDKYRDCGNWALSGYCNDPSRSQWMRQNCVRSCGIC